MTESACTPGQTVGPFFGLGLSFPGDSLILDPGHPEAIRLHGTVYDGADAAVEDALVELWQPDSAGDVARQAGSLRRGPTTFSGWGRCATDAAGSYSFTTLTPGSAIAGRPPFFALSVFARGLLDRLFTRAYLPGAEAHSDPLLAAVAAERRSTLLCVAEINAAAYRFDIHLQGPTETVFLAYSKDPR
ncbi:protocatechuate 3,4-dioxygenase subunit alpha [Mycobacterium sp. 852002-51971_SCH5477799-a]|uniref:protocatechuate 3,4-dioxygenase subunit alpha n=1 Tax=Mycobacterium sp. 852002-51971_SCH5477799-a TaxID=1834106 RepID=UPI0007FFC723|nr:protocatechuate 3,4-dioxygenase subunit alpha [Mycobacterium sp. 852002-51971_SCH5477799-a]OBF65157.1 protocatechuate 3,4-dioxygenase subunit alpha [Mycobacterium sp. 852002-51971_SCH5477799-a]